jgi:hypothetical protein
VVVEDAIVTVSPATFTLALLACVAVSWRNAVAQGAPVLPERTGPSRWTVIVGLDQGWDSNVRMSTPDDPGDFHEQVGVRIARTWQTDRTRATLSGTGGVARFRELTDENRSRYGGSVSITRHFTRRFTGQLEYAFQSAVTGHLAETVEGGLQLPVVQAHSHDATGSATYQLGRRSTLAVTGRYTDISFPSGVLVGGHELGGQATITRQVNRGSALELTYGYQHSVTMGERADSHTASGGWNQRLGRALTMRVTAGVTRLESMGTGAGTSLRAVGSGEMQLRLGQNLLTGRLERSVSQGYGLGRVLSTDRLTGQYARVITQDVSLTLRGDLTQNRDPSDPTFTFRAGDCALDIGFPIAWGLVADVGGFARGWQQGVRVISTGVRLGVGYGGLP